MTSSNKKRFRFEVLSGRASVSELELFFDLVFVFALTRVTDLLAEHTTGVAVLHSLMVLAVMWWVWIGYAWLGNVVRADRGLVKLGIFVALGACFVLALTIPEAFADLAGGLSGPLVFAIGYFVVRVVHWVMFWIVSGDDPQLHRQLVRWAPSLFVATALFVWAAQTSGTAQTLIWVAALAADYLGTLVAGNDWRLNSPNHFAERHGLIIIVALGESIVSIGIGVVDLPISLPIITGSLLGLLLSSAMWWVYFDMTAPGVERALHRLRGTEQIRVARSAYTYLHLPMVVGIIGLSLGLKKVLSYAGGEGHHTLRDSISGIPLYLMFGGVALYLLALIGFKFVATGSVTVTRVIAAILVMIICPFTATLPALATLGLLTAVLIVLVGYETVHFPELRSEIRDSAAHPE